MHSQIVGSYIFGALSFRRCFPEKVSFIILNALDILLTVAAYNMGLKELNPVMANMLTTPWLLISIKLALPILIAWLLPGKWLWPALALMCLVIGWDVKELLIFLSF
jgi:hypothetical protein